VLVNRRPQFGVPMSSDEPAERANLSPGYFALPAHLHGIADAAFRMVEEGECPDGMLNKLKRELNKSRPQGE